MDSISQNAWDQDLTRCLALCGFILALYDYILTFPAELDRFWSPLKIRQWGTLIFITNRYVGLWGHLPVLYSYFFVPPPDTMVGQQDSECYPLHKYHQFLAVIVQTSAGAILLTRVYALWDRNRVILWVLLVYYFGFAGFAAWAITQGKSQASPSAPPNLPGCIRGLSKDEGFYFGLVWGGIMAFDSTVFALTAYKSLALWRQGSRGLIHIVMRDGVIYYAVLGFSTLANSLTFLFGSVFTRGMNTTITNLRVVIDSIVTFVTDGGGGGHGAIAIELDNTRGFLPSADPVTLTAVVMDDMSTFQMVGEEARSIGVLDIEVVSRT